MRECKLLYKYINRIDIDWLFSVQNLDDIHSNSFFWDKEFRFNFFLQKIYIIFSLYKFIYFSFFFFWKMKALELLTVKVSKSYLFS